MTAPRPLGFWVRTVDQMLDAQFEQAAEATGLSRREWQILNRLRIGAVADSALAAALAPFLDGEETVDELLDRLDREGLLEHQAHEYRLTDRGVERVEEVQRDSVQQIRDRATDGLSEEDYEQLLATLERVARNLGWEPA